MKVCTDACIQGAYAAQWLKKQSRLEDKQKILDVGTGTGLLALMLSQELPHAVVDAVEIDEGAFRQATENIRASPWNNRLKVFHDDIRNWNTGVLYDFIISNPPFFDQDLKSPDELKNWARHGTHLSYDDLAVAIAKYLLAEGKACIMLPPKQFNAFLATASVRNIYPLQILHIKHSMHEEPFRTIGILSRGEKNAAEEALSIRDGSGSYTPLFKELLRNYYLSL